jgi:hypothetical protein
MCVCVFGGVGLEAYEKLNRISGGWVKSHRVCVGEGGAGFIVQCVCMRVRAGVSLSPEELRVCGGIGEQGRH